MNQPVTKRAIPGFEGKYEVWDTGDIYSLERTDIKGRKQGGRILKGTPDKDGYIKITLTISRGDQQTYRAHQLIAEAFVPGCQPGLQVNHKDLNKQNNHPSNLEWVTPKQNTQHAWANGRTAYDRSKPYNRTGIVARNKARRKYRYTDDDVSEMQQMYARGTPQHLIAAHFHCKQGTISQYLRGLLTPDMPPK
jgi:hypothetical protein